MKTRAKLKRTKPDEVVNFGPFAAARFGKNVIWQSNMSADQHAAFLKQASEHLPDVIKQIDEAVKAIASDVARLPADKLLHRAWWELAGRTLKMEVEADVTTEDAIAYRMIDYIQSMVAAVQPLAQQASEVTEEDWGQLRAKVEELFLLVNGPYQISRTAEAKLHDSKYDDDAEEFFFKAQSYWCNVRGERYQSLEEAYLKDLFLPHTAVFEELFGITADVLVEELVKILKALTFGVNDAFLELKSFQEDTMAAAQAKMASGHAPQDIGAFLREVAAENGWSERGDRIVGILHGFDLFDVGKLTLLPEALLDELTWAPGENTTFFADGDYKGWPLRVWPIFKRPFIRLDGRVMCFDLHNLFDHIYRVMQRLIIRLKPSYAETWNRVQQDLSETLPLKYLHAILPGAKIYRSVYYNWFNEPGQKAKNWCETDGLLIYDDHLFIVEARGGAFTHSSPAEDFPAFIKSLQNLILKPATQGKRFLAYLESADVVEIFNKDHVSIGQLRKTDYRQISICPVTLDPFTELAAQAQHLRKVGVDVGQRPVWPISIDDLRVYADIFENPLQFLHYVEQRNEAFNSDVVQSDDELDHLGLYLEHNHYSKHAAELRGRDDAFLSFLGYRSSIDRFYAERLNDPSYPCPLKQKTPARVLEIVQWLARAETPGRSRLAAYLLDMAGDERERLAGVIDSELKGQPTRGRPIGYSLSGRNMIGYTLFCYTCPPTSAQRAVALDHTKQALLIAEQPIRLLLELSYNERFALEEVYWTWIDVQKIPEAELADLKVKAEALRAKRLHTSKEFRGKTGRNAPCPCGSGKKYKKCCLE